MSHQVPHVAGAVAPLRPDDQNLQDYVTALLRFSIKDVENLNRYSISDCDYVLQEMVEYAYNPAGKPRRTLPVVFGEMFLLHQRRAQLLAAEHQAQLSQLQHSYQAVLEENRRLRQDRLRSGCEILWLQDASRDLRAQIQSLQKRAEDRREEGQTGQTSTAVDVATQEPSDVPDLEEVPPPGATSRSLPQEAVEVKEQMTPVHQEMQASSLATPGDAVSDLNSPDDCQVPPSAHPMDAGAPHSDGAPPSILSHTPSCPERRGEDHITDESGVGASRPPLTSELKASQSSQPCLNRTPSPPRRGRSHPHRHGDLSDSGVSDVADSPPPHRRQRLRTRQLESLTSDVECLDSDSQDSDIDDYLQEVEGHQGESPHLTRPARGQKDDAGVLWIHTSGDANLALEGNKMPRVKMDGRTGPRRCRPPRKRNHRGDDQTFPLSGLFQPFPLPGCMEQPPHRRGVEPPW